MSNVPHLLNGNLVYRVTPSLPFWRCASPFGSLGRSSRPRGSNPSSSGSRSVTVARRRGGEERAPGETRTGSSPERVPPYSMRTSSSAGMTMASLAAARTVLPLTSNLALIWECSRGLIQNSILPFGLATNCSSNSVYPLSLAARKDACSVELIVVPLEICCSFQLTSLNSRNDVLQNLNALCGRLNQRDVLRPQG